MDQVKKQLAVVLQYGFWIVSAIVLIGSLGVWYMTTSKLAAENASQTSKLNSAHSSVVSVRGDLPTQPNDFSHKEMDLLIEARKADVLKAWESLYERQRGILTWPTEEVDEEVVKRFEDKIPIEVYVEYPTAEEDEIESYLRTQYQRYIGDVLPSIAEIAKAEWTASFNKASTVGGAGPGGPAGMNPYMNSGKSQVSISGSEMGPLVKWSESSQSALLEDLFPWRGRGTPPTTLEVYYSQENLWILRQLLQIIASVNGDAKQPYQAKIHEIATIGIGKSVSFDSGQIAKPGESLSAGRFGSMGMEGYDGMMEMDSLMEGGAMGMGTVELPDPGENRYVNTKNEPITGSALRSALSSNAAADAELAVAKRVPVMMQLQMDQRAVQQLVAACGSAPLMVEVRQVRILPKDGIAKVGGTDQMAMMESEGEMMSSGPEMGGMQGGMPATKKPAEEFPMDMGVEIYGLIYMYNPPDPVKLGVEQVDSSTVIEGVTDEPPVAAAATPGTTPPTAPGTEDVLPVPAADDPAADDPATDDPAADDPSGDPGTPPADASPATDPATDTAPPVAGTGGAPTPPAAIAVP